MQRNQLFLDDLPLDKNKSFLEKIYLCDDLMNKSSWIDEIDYSKSIRRVVNENISIKEFSELMTTKFMGRLQFGSPVGKEIRFCQRGSYCIGNKSNDIFAWTICDYNQQNYDLVSKLYESVYDISVESIEVPESLTAYHEMYNLK